MMRCYEIQTFRDGKWKIEAVFDDLELATYDAERLFSGSSRPAVRVIEETYDNATGTTSTRTMFRRTRMESHNQQKLEERKETRRQAHDARGERQVRKEKVVAHKRKRQAERQTTGLAVKLAVVLLIAAVVIAAVPFLSRLQHVLG